MMMTTSFAVPITEGKPLSTNAYIDDSSRRDAVLATLSQVIETNTAVVDDLAGNVRPLVEFLTQKQKALRGAVETDPTLKGIRDYRELFFAELGDSDNWPGLRAFVAAAEASSDCNLDTTS